jgi:hypothetical protein
MRNPPLTTSRNAPRPTEHATWPCRFCQQRDTVVITLRRAGTVVCFCAACEQGWTTDDRGQPRP